MGRETLRGTGGCLEEAASREGDGSSQPPDPARPRGRLMASSPAGSLWPPPCPHAQTWRSRGVPARNTSARLRSRPGTHTHTHTSAFRGLLCPEVTTRRRGSGKALKARGGPGWSLRGRGLGKAGGRGLGAGLVGAQTNERWGLGLRGRACGAGPGGRSPVPAPR